MHKEVSMAWKNLLVPTSAEWIMWCNAMMVCNCMSMYVPKYRADNLLKSMHVLGLLSDELLAVWC